MAWSKESRHSRGYGSEWTKLRTKIMERDKGLCQVCFRKGQITLAKEVDHITSKAEAKRLMWGAARIDHPLNLQAICPNCHKAKTAEENGQTYRPKVEIGEDGWPIEK